MFNLHHLWGKKPDLNATDTSRLNSPFIDIENVPRDLNKLPSDLAPFIWFFVKQIKWPYLFICCAFMFTSIITVMLPWFVSQITTVFEQNLTGDAFWAALKPALWSAFIWLIVFDSVAYHAARQVWMHFTIGFNAMIVRQLCQYVWKHSLDYFQNDFAGRISNKINDVAWSVRQIARDFAHAFIFAAAQFIVMIAMSATIHRQYLTIVLVYIAVYITVIVTMVPKILRVSMAVQDSKTIITGNVVDTITNIYNVKLFARRPFETDRITGRLYDYARKGRHMSAQFNWMYLAFDLSNKLFFTAMFGLLSWKIYTGEDSFSTAVLLTPLVIGLSHTIFWFGDMLIMLFEQLGTIKDGINTIVKPFKVRDSENAKFLTIKEPQINLKNLSFAYPGREVFTNLSLTIPAGQKIGLVGPSGAGKSTLVQLLLRLHDIQGGAIEIDGQNIADVTQDSLRDHIAVIPQSSDLLHRSIRENIAYGRLNATEEEIIEAAKKAHAHEFILTLQDHEGRTGYDAMVGERGVKLSGGQRQRIAIARAVLKNAPILLLDEATSALDSESEAMIQESLKDLMHGRTVIAIAHRLSTIAQLDRLLVMEDGKIIEDGSHYELLERKGLYARLWALQSGGFLPEE